MKRHLLAALIAASVFALSAQAAKPLTPQERKAKADQARKHHELFKQPRTMAQAEATAVRQPDGTTTLAMPTELWNSLSVQRDAAGQLRVREFDGDTVPSANVEGDDHE